MFPSSLPLLREGLLQRIYEAIGRPPIRVAMASGEEVAPESMPPVGSVVMRDDRTLLRLCLDPDLGFGDAYTAGRLRIEGDLAALLEAVYHSAAAGGRTTWFHRLAEHWQKWAQRNTLRGSKQNIHHHYDLSNEFYRLWLDREMVYTCAYFPTPQATLEEAQLAKMEHVCRKLRLQPGERVVEAGCGWGALALHMARNYGVRVRAFNVSHEQITFARERAVREGLDGRVEFVEDDYRNIAGTFDVFVSVGMLEHVGRESYQTLGRVIHNTIGATGRGLLHFIGRSRPQPVNLWLSKRIFPGSYAPTLREAMEVLEPWSFAVRDVENLGPHYAETLRHWLVRFEAAVPQLKPPLDDERFVRAWRLYLTGVMAGFRAGILQLFQVVFAGAACREIPWTRAYLYEEEAVAERETQWKTAAS